MVRRLIALLACLALALSLYAQEASTLYRGRRPTQYSFRYNGTYFWESRSFQQGSILYNGKQYDNVLLNIDACQMEVLVRESATSAPVVLYDKAVKGFRMGKAYYVNLRNLGFADAPAGYFELVRDGEKPLLLQVQKIYRTDSGNHNGKDIGFSDPDYQNSVPDYFYRFERYYSVNEGKVVFLACLGPQQREGHAAGWVELHAFAGKFGEAVLFAEHANSQGDAFAVARQLQVADDLHALPG